MTIYDREREITISDVVRTIQPTTPELQEFLDRIEYEAVYLCHSCNEFVDEDELVELRECPFCEEVFDGSEGRNCPICNRPFTRNLHVMGCSTCLDHDNPPEIATAELIKEAVN